MIPFNPPIDSFVPKTQNAMMGDSIQRTTQRTTTNTNQIPLPRRDKEIKNVMFETIPRSNVGGKIVVPPMSTEIFRTLDGGNSNPKFLSSTFYAAPKTKDLFNKVGCAWTVSMSPLAKLNALDKPMKVPTVNFTVKKSKQDMKPKKGFLPFFGFGQKQEEEKEEKEEKVEKEEEKILTDKNEIKKSLQIRDPPRCRRCRGYINPFCKFIDQGKAFVCNLCGCENNVPDWYYEHVDSSGKRVDLGKRPELRYGSYDFSVDYSEDYNFKPLNDITPLTYVFILDISSKAKRQGVFQTVLSSLRSLISSLAKNQGNSKFAILTYSKSIQFYNFKTSSPKVCFVGDLLSEEKKKSSAENFADAYLPFPVNSLLTFAEFEKNADEHFTTIMQVSKNIQETENCLGSVILYGSKLIEQTGGKLIVFSSAFSNVGLGKSPTVPRSYVNQYGNDKTQGQLFTESKETGYFYSTFGSILKMKGISLDIFLFPESDSLFLESGILSQLCKKVSGRLYIYPKFSFTNEGSRLFEDIKKLLSPDHGYDGILILRTSEGVTAINPTGNFEGTGSEQIDLPFISTSSTVTCEILFDDKIPSNHVYLQAALLYTSNDGKRKVRIHNLSLPTTPSIDVVFKYLRFESLLLHAAKKYSSLVLSNSKTIDFARQQITNLVINLLFSYRLRCVPDKTQRRLILTDSIRYLPIYALGLLKSNAFKSGTSISLDQKIVSLYNINSMNHRNFLNTIYPRLIPLHNVALDMKKKLPLVNSIDLSAANIESHGIYLFDDTNCTICYISKKVSPTLLKTIFGVDKLSKIKLDSKFMIDNKSVIGQRIKKIITTLTHDRHYSGKLSILSADMPRKPFFERLTNDQVSNEMSYHQYVGFLHSQIMQKLN